MNKRVLIFLFLLASVQVFGQKKSVVNLVSSTYMHGLGKNVFKVYNGVFKQDFSTLTSDSAIFYRDENRVDAFGHVVINQGDTLNIYSDKLHYNGNTKVAVLTDHVKMVDKDATLTTNYFTYNTATRIGIYNDGGKLVNKDNTLTSKNGYYFAKSRDEYFRYDVVCTTPDVIIKTDTMRYNSGTRITYFYGPSNIYGKSDKDTLYTENGTYNTNTEQSAFGKNNLYKQGTKTLTGDSLFYDRIKGYGRAVKHVIFHDTEQKMTLRGGLGEYYKANENTIMTIYPYLVLEVQDSTKTDSANKKPAANSASQKLTLQGITDSVTKKRPATASAKIPNIVFPGMNGPEKKEVPAPVKAAPAVKKAPARANAKGKSPTAKKPATVIAEATQKRPRDNMDIGQAGKLPRNGKFDSLYMVADTLETRMMTYKEFKVLQEQQLEYNNRDTSIKKTAPSIVYTNKNMPKFLTANAPKWPRDTGFLRPQLVGKPIAPVRKVAPKTPPKVAKVNIPKKTAQDSVNDKRKADSLALDAPRVLSDTARVRILKAHHHAKLFKSDLQAKADSMFWSSSDSTIRCYVNPMIWTEGSQLSGDTINLRMKNKKLDNLDMFPSAFIVNIEKKDSVYFNQVGGKTMHGTFKNSKLNTFLVTGNAETIYFRRDTVKNKVLDMTRSRSAKIYATFKNNELSIADFTGGYEGGAIPLSKAKEEDKKLRGFIWKPQERPVSKESLLAIPAKKPAAVKGNTKAGAAVKKPEDLPVKKDSLITPPVLKTVNDAGAMRKTPTKKP